MFICFIGSKTRFKRKGKSHRSKKQIKLDNQKADKKNLQSAKSTSLKSTSKSTSKPKPKPKVTEDQEEVILTRIQNLPPEVDMSEAITGKRRLSTKAELQEKIKKTVELNAAKPKPKRKYQKKGTKSGKKKGTFNCNCNYNY